MTAAENAAVGTLMEISADQAPAIYGHNTLSNFVNAAREQVSGEVPDVTTRKGRERIASLAAQVSRSKTAVEKPGRDYLRTIKELPKKIEAELRDFVSQMDTLRDEVRKPLDDWEAEQARIQRELEEREASIEASIQRLRGACVTKAEDDSATIIRYLQALSEEYNATGYGPRDEEAQEAYETSTLALTAALTRRQQYEAEQAELAELRRKQAEADQRERERKIAEEAAEQARQAAERKAEDERKAAEARVKEAEETARLAEQRAAQAAEQARLDQEAEQRRQAEEAAQRQANQEHRLRILTAAKEAVMGAGITEEEARAVVRLIAAGKVPNVTISY